MKTFHSGPQPKFKCAHCKHETIHKANLSLHIQRKHEKTADNEKYDYDQVFKVFNTLEDKKKEKVCQKQNL